MSDEDEENALGFLAGRFSFRSFDDGDTIVPESALVALAEEGLKFVVMGKPTYEHFFAKVRNPAAAPIQ